MDIISHFYQLDGAFPSNKIQTTSIVTCVNAYVEPRRFHFTSSIGATTTEHWDVLCVNQWFSKFSALKTLNTQWFWFMWLSGHDSKLRFAPRLVFCHFSNLKPNSILLTMSSSHIFGLQKKNFFSSIRGPCRACRVQSHRKEIDRSPRPSVFIHSTAMEWETFCM